MGSPMPLVPQGRESFSDRPAYDEPTSLRLSPTPMESYRCPVSTPSNFVQRYARIRRTKPMENIYSQPASGGRSHRSRGALTLRHSSTTPISSRLKSKSCNPVEYYYVDRQGDTKDAAQTNTRWLQALCSQPVDEILNKYRRKSDVKRTRIIWSKTFSTPGEKSLLNAWENTSLMGRSQGVQSAAEGGARDRRVSQRKLRHTQSEPPLSRTHHHHTGAEGSPSPRPLDQENRGPREHSQLDIGPSDDDIDRHPGLSAEKPGHHHHHPHRIKGFLLDESSSGNPSRVSSYTTQYFRSKSNKIFSKVTAGPQHLPRLSAQDKVWNAFSSSNTDYSYFQRCTSPQTPPTHDGPGDVTPGISPLAIQEETEDAQSLQEMIPAAADCVVEEED